MKTRTVKAEKVIDRALVLLRTEGDRGVTMRRVAQDADMSLSNVQYYFKNKDALERFKAGRFEGSAAATAIGGKKGAAAASKYKDGVAIMVLPLKGGMAEAAGGGQKFAFEPL